MQATLNQDLDYFNTWAEGMGCVYKTFMHTKRSMCICQRYVLRYIKSANENSKNFRGNFPS